MIGALVGAVLGAAVTAAGFVALGPRACPTEAAADSAGEAPPDDAAQLAQIDRLEAELAMLERAVAATGDRATMARLTRGDLAMSPDDTWWTSRPEDPAAQARSRAVIDRLGHLGIALDASAVACRRPCCRITLRAEDADLHADALFARAGLGYEPLAGTATASTPTGARVITACWRSPAADDASAGPAR
ncbi:MAG: hypothetical protein K8W52_26185 [Deltaproteobacteria bacterium]|nr:hypothetical protein [Deltaproteobacteria bacterium]